MDKQHGFSLSYIHLKVVLISEESAQLPFYLGSTLRGVIGHTLQQDKEAYDYLYRNYVFSNHKMDVVNPYMIIPSLQEQGNYPKGSELEFEIILLGDAQCYTVSVIKALSRIHNLGLGVMRSPFILQKVLHKQDQRIIWQDGYFNSIAMRQEELPYLCLLDVKKVILQIHTPLRIRRKGKILLKIDFPTIFRNIANRMEELTKRYGGWVDKEEIASLMILSQDIIVVREELRLEELKRYSNRQGKTMDLSGLLGSIEFEGNITPFVPWLYAIQKLHIGRNTTFGMGNITVEFM